MIQAGGAMALFVLRLAGLLSLEKSLGENSTSAILENETYHSAFHSGNNSFLESLNETYLSTYYNNFTAISFTTPQYSSILDIDNNTLSISNSSNVKDIYNGTKIWQSLNGRLPDSGTIKKYSKNGFDNETDESFKKDLSFSKNESDIFLDILLYNDTDLNKLNIEQYNDTEKISNISNRLLELTTLNPFLKELLPDNAIKISASSEDDNSSLVLPEAKKPNGSSKFSKTKIRTFDSIFKTTEISRSTSRDSFTGFSPVRSSSNNITAGSSIPSSPTPITRELFPIDLHKPRTENIFTVDKSSDLYNNSAKYVGMDKIPYTEFENRSAEYFDLEENASISSNYSVDLINSNTTNPIKQPSSETIVKYIDKESKRGHKNFSSIRSKSKSTNRGNNKRNFSALAKRPEASTHSKELKNESLKRKGPGMQNTSSRALKTIVRNNPFPYGPKILPHNIFTQKPKLQILDAKEGTGKTDNIYLEKDIIYNYDEELITEKEEKIIDKQIEEDGRVEGGGLKENDDNRKLIIDEENEVQNISEIEKKYFAKTDKPRVLFHFEKPGYSPKVPDSSVLPTRRPTPSDPWDCSPRCPSYTLLDWNQDYDIRQYLETTWISTVIIAENRIFAELEGYMRVQDYFYGLNDRGQVINLTVPFVTQIKHGRHPGVLKEFTDFSISIYINHDDDPLNYDLPTPISNEVLIDHLESKIVFVTGFEANVWDVTEKYLENKALELMEKLRQNGEAFLDRYYYLASYSRPELYQPVYYELWIYATSFRDKVIAPPPVAPRRRPPPSKITADSMSKLCRGVECPSFEVLRTYRYGIQKRRYFDGVFVTTSPGVCEFSTLSVWKGFMPLHLYKHGINSHLEVIEATRPIGLIHVKEDSTSTTECPQNMTMAIYLPKRLHSNPPLTGYDAPPVFINALQDVVVYAYTVGGYLLEPDRVRKELADLKFRLTEFGACYKEDEYYVVVYDFIMRYHGRQNEIWVVAENCKATVNG